MTAYIAENLHVELYPDYMKSNYATNLFNYLLDNVKWKSRGNKRTAVSYGNPGVTYQYKMGGYGNRPEVIIDREVIPWNELPKLEIVRDVLSEFTDITYDYCVIQLYPNGNSGIKPHKDKEMGIESSIVGLSLGATRTLTFSPPKYNRRCNEGLSLELPSGSLYIMHPPTNRHWTHCIETDASIVEPRISLTFRNK